MTRLGSFHFYPGRVMWLGSAILFASLLLSIPLWVSLSMNDSPVLSFNKRKESNDRQTAYSFSLGLSEADPILFVPDLQNEITFSFDQPRPGENGIDRELEVQLGERARFGVIRMKKSCESKRVLLPCRVDLEFQRDKLVFSKEKSLFWVDLSLAASGQIEGKTYISSLDGNGVAVGSFMLAGQDCPVRSPQEFPEGSPFRFLAEAKWWGRDPFQESKSGERLEIGTSPLLEVGEGDWLIYKGQKWEKGTHPQNDVPLARVQSFSMKGLVLEGWDLDAHIRVCLSPAVGLPFKTRGEDLLSAIRIRSEKQISCMLEKQCMVLKAGDWVLKTGGRWKVLRKQHERDAFIGGKLLGEFFVFDQIAQKQGQKMIQGRLFNPGRTQVLPIEMAVQSTRKARDKGKRI